MKLEPNLMDYCPDENKFIKKSCVTIEVNSIVVLQRFIFFTRANLLHLKYTIPF